MYTTYHLPSAQEINADIMDSIKITFKSKPIIIIVEEDRLTTDMKTILENRLQEDEAIYITAEDSINQLNKRYGL